MREISVQELRDVLAKKDKDTLVIDVRTKAEYDAARIGDVPNTPLDEIEKYADELKKYKTVYAYCQSGNRSGQACRRLEALGLADVASVQGGIIEWERLGFEVCRGQGYRIPIMRQVLLAAGSLILFGFLLFWLVHPYFLILPFIVGCGLVFAGATGKCFMMMALLRMPWNKGGK